MIVVGIDPGKKGGLVRLTETTQEGIMMPLMGKEIDGHAIAMWLREQRPDIVVVEKVGAMKGQGVTSMFTFGKGAGKIEGVLEALAIPYQLVTPQAWKKKVLAGTSKDKDAAIAFVSRKYPDLNLIPARCRTPQDGIADACCMAEFAKDLV